MLFDRKARRRWNNYRRFSRKRVDLDKFVKDFYVDNGLAFISCNVRGYYDIIDRYSVEGYEWLDSSFTRFIEENARYIPAEYPIVLEICGHRFSRKQEEYIEETVADYYGLKMGDTQIELARNRNRLIVLAVFAVSFAGLMTLYGGILGKTGVLKEAVLVLFWLFVWELADGALFERTTLMQARTEAARLASVKVTFQLKFEDNPIEEEEKENILEEVFEDDIILPSTEW